MNRHILDKSGGNFLFWDSPATRTKPGTSGANNLLDFLAAVSRPTVYYDRLINPTFVGQGTSFVVHRCEDNETGTIVAVKKPLPAENSSNSEPAVSVVDAILMELKIAAHPEFVDHPHVTKTLGFEKDPFATNNISTLSLVMEYTSLGSLNDYLGTLDSPTDIQSWSHRRYLCRDVTAGLEALHHSQIIHGDVKLENILVFPGDPTTGASRYIAKISDFGSAIVKDTTSRFIGVNGPPIYRGTPLYVSPLVRQSIGPLPFHLLPACDLFSLGLVFWSIFQGAPYYQRSWKNDHETDEGCLDRIGIQGLRDRFDDYVATINDSCPTNEITMLRNAVASCITDISMPRNSPLPPVAAPSVYRRAFSAVTQVKTILTTVENWYIYPWILTRVR